MASQYTRRLRINVSAMLSNEVVAKFLVVVDEVAGMNQLLGKVQQCLKSSGVHSTVDNIMNSFRAILPSDEAIGDILRDGEEIIVSLRGDDGQLLQDRPSARNAGVVPAPTSVFSPKRRSPRAPDAAAGADVNLSKSGLEYANAGGGAPVPGSVSLMAIPSAPHQFGIVGGGNDPARVLPVRAKVTLPPQIRHESDSEDETGGYAEEEDEPAAPLEDYPPRPHELKGAREGAALIPGPNEEFEIERMPYETMVIDHPCDPVQLTSYDNDWLVESLTPRLREFIMSRFSADLITEPKYVPSIGKFVGAKFLQASGSFVSVFMRPQTAISSDPNATMPVHYNIPKATLSEFQRKAEKNMEEMQSHQDLFRASVRALRALLAQGMSETDHVNVMLPHSYDAFDEVEGNMLEAEKPLLPMKGSGSHPVIVIDTSGAVAEHIEYVKAAVKRSLHSHVSGKASFQLIRFMPASGEPRLWAQDMMKPSENALQAAEDWVDALRPANDGRLVTAVRFALAHRNCDEIFIISSADCLKTSQHESVLAGIRAVNKAEVAIHTIGVEPTPEGELLLRNVAESNHGDFTLKSFRDQGIGRANAICKADSKWTSWRTNLVNEKSKQLSDSFKQEKMSIGSQIKIIEVMQREEAQKEYSWNEEWRCAQRLLLSQKDPRSGVPDRDMVKELERSTTRTVCVRTGGGFLYDTEEVKIGMEDLFEHRAAVPWTAHADTLAVGPKVPMPDAGYDRTAKFPPSREQMPMAPAHESDPYLGGPMYGRSRAQEMRQRQAAGGSSNPWGAPIDRTRRPPSAQRRGRGTSLRRTSSADRAAGERAASPARSGSRQRRRSQTPPAAAERRRQGGRPKRTAEMESTVPPLPPPSPPPTQEDMTPGLERRWSF
eukprot:TRINITY_DN31315_c0_g1_i1.p1 TRINITY_DN31315_c0_g1~~TRINITY_DN31315_c0_g1_i1.p1  ORF type:complete len:905 (+),score=166.07 TRINITY_DN31315_c0_g1_i1:56-2716(+)